MEDQMMASSSAHDATSSRKQLRKRVDRPAYSMPGQETPAIAISDQFGPPIEPALVPLARSLFLFDLELLRRVNAIARKHRSSQDETRNTEALHRIQEYVEIKRQWKDINISKRTFSQSYMQDKYFVPVWVEGLRIMKDALSSSNASGKQGNMQNDFVDILAGYKRLASNLKDQMVDTAHQGLLDKGVLYSIQARWIRLDELLEWYHDPRHSRNRDLDKDIHLPTRDTPKWQEVRYLVQMVDPKTKSDKELIPAQFVGKPRNAKQTGTPLSFLGSRTASAVILWSTLFGCAVTSTATFALGYAHSPHLRGTTNDADFWFLIQATIMQLLGLITSAILEWKSGSIPKWRSSLPIAVAGICSVTAIPLYLVLPTEWSSFLSLTAGATQSFMVLQYALSERE